MKWARGDVLLAGFLASMGLGVLVLGYLLYSAYGSYTKIAENYETQARELDRLRSTRPYPDAGNLRLAEERRDALAGRIEKLQSTLAAIEIPLVSLTPEQFQDDLRRTVSEVAEKAAAQGTNLPPNFYLGFQQYRDTLPADSEAISLGRELKAIKFVVCALLDNRVTNIVEVNRDPRSQSESVRLESNSETRGHAAADNQEQDRGALVTRHPFQVGFTATQAALRRALNTIASTPQQYYIIDLLNVANEELTGPPRDDPSDSLQDGTLSKDKIQLVVGDEKLNVKLRIEIVDFLDPNENSAK